MKKIKIDRYNIMESDYGLAERMYGGEEIGIIYGGDVLVQDEFFEKFLKEYEEEPSAEGGSNDNDSFDNNDFTSPFLDMGRDDEDKSDIPEDDADETPEDKDVAGGSPENKDASDVLKQTSDVLKQTSAVEELQQSLEFVSPFIEIAGGSSRKNNIECSGKVQEALSKFIESTV